MTCEKSLVAALDSEGDERLRHLVAAWRKKRAPELAALVIAVGADLDRKRPSIKGKDLDVRLHNWLAIDQDDTLTGWLLSTWPLQDTSSRHYTPRLARVAKWAPDPRIAEAMMMMIVDNSFGLHAEFWDPVFAQLVACGDRTFVPRLETELDRLGYEKFFHSRITKAIAALKKVKSSPLSADQAAIVAQMQPADDSALLAAVYQNPDDDAPRLVYADYLQQKGDPRGEYIALACAKNLDVTGRKRLRELYGKFKLEWFGPLEPAILEQKSLGYDRGFLATAHVCAMWGLDADDVSSPREQAIRALQDHPAWATLHEVKLAKIAQKTRPLLLAHLKKLRVKVTFVKS